MTYFDSKKAARRAALLLCTLICDVSGAAEVRFVRDINATSPSADSDPADFTSFDGQLYFTADDGVHGRELWRSDGTAGGTSLVADLVHGATGSKPNHLFVFNDTLFLFAADENGVSYLLGLARGSGSPTRLAQLYPGPCTEPVVVQGRLLFSTGFQLWTSDGTPSGTLQIDNAVTPTPHQPCQLRVVGDTLYFMAYREVAGGSQVEAIWSSNGTAAGTQVFLAQSPGKDEIDGLGDGIVYFNHRSADSSGGVYRTDGTPSGTIQLLASSEVRPTGYTRSNLLGISNGRLLAGQTIVSLALPGPVRTSLLFGDGSPGGFVSVGAPLDSSTLLIASSRVFFVNGSVAGEEPWVTDGTREGTVMLRDIVPNGSPVVEWFGDYYGTYLIRLVDPNAGPQLWQTDGTPGGTQFIANIAAEPPSKFVQGVGTIYVPDHGPGGPDYFFVGLHEEFGNELYVYWSDAPIAAADSGTSQNGGAIELQVLANDRARDGTLDPASVRIASAPAHGTATIQAQGSVTYTPTAGYSGSDSFTYTVADTQGRRAQPATVTVTVTVAAPPAGNQPSKSGGGALGAAAIFALLSMVAAARMRWFARK